MFAVQQLVECRRDSIEAVLEEWQSRWPTLCVLALLPEKEQSHVPLIQRCANRLNLPLIGAIFPALLGQPGFITDGAWLLCLERAPARFLLADLQDQGQARLVEAIQAAHHQTWPDALENCTLFTIFDAMVPNIGSLMEQVHVSLAEQPRYLGVSAGSETFQPMPCLFDNEKIVGNGVLGILLPNAPRAVVCHEYSVSESRFWASSSHGNRIESIDNRPAFEVYQALVKSEYGVDLTRDNFYQLAVHFPFGVMTAVDVLVRIPVSLGDDGSLYCVGEIPPHSMLRLLCAPKQNDSRCIQVIQSAFAETAQFADPHPLFFFYCAGRKLHFEEHAATELEQVKRATNCSNLYGALSLGEIDSLDELLLPRFHNAALVCWPQKTR